MAKATNGYYKSSVDQYFAEIRKKPLLSREEEQDLGKKIEAARNELIKLIVKNQPEVISEYFASTDGSNGALREHKRKYSQLEQGLSAYCRQEGFEQIEKEAEQRLVSFFSGINFWDHLRNIAADYKKRSNGEETREAEALLRRWEKYRNQFVGANQRMVVDWAQVRYSPKNPKFLDLVQDLNPWLMKAVDKYDYHRGKRFSSLAYEYLKRGLHEESQYDSPYVRRIKKAWQKVEKEFSDRGDPASKSRVAQKVADRSRDAIDFKEVLAICGKVTTISLENKVGPDSRSLEEVIPDQQPGADEKLDEFRETYRIERAVEEALSELTKDEQTMIKMFTGFDDQIYGYQEIAKVFGCTRQNIKQRVPRILEKLRKSLSPSETAEDIETLMMAA